MFTILIELIVGLVSHAGSNNPLDTKKIDRHIDQLYGYKWFRKVYEDEKYRRLFFANKRIRSYLESNRRVKKMIKRKESQKKLLFLLDKERNT